jgi:hypothetical protein
MVLIVTIPPPFEYDGYVVMDQFFDIALSTVFNVLGVFAG